MGIRTTRKVPVRQLGLPPEQAAFSHAYKPTPYGVLEDMLLGLPIDAEHESAWDAHPRSGDSSGVETESSIARAAPCPTVRYSVPTVIQLPERASMQAYQRYIHELEALHGWLDVDLVHNCFLMGEEVGELFKSIRKYGRLFEDQGAPAHDDVESSRTAVAEEIVDVLNYLLAIANRLNIDIEAAFRNKNAKNQTRSWGPEKPTD